MVYESDFYTTRRPYSRPTPTISSYSVTAQPYHRHLPFVAHKRLTTPQAAPPRSKVRNSVLMAEIDRINHRVRPHPAYVPTEDWLNSACSVNFDDETRSIRAQTAALLKRVHSPIPRSRGPLHAVLPTPSCLMELPVPNRHTSDHYIEGLLAPISKVQRDVASRSFYVEHPRPYIGRGHLACVSFAGGRAYAKRRNHYDVPEDHHNVQDDIATLSYYNRARAVANGQEPGPEPAATSTRKSRPYRAAAEPAPKVEPTPAPAAPRPAATPVRQASVQEDPVAEAAAEAELAAETKAEAVTNGVASEDDEAAKLAEEEAELERQLEAELRAEMEAKEAKKAKKAAAKKAAEEAEAQRQADEAAAQKVAEEAAAAQKAAAEAAAAAAAEAEAEAAAEAARKAAEEEAELERIVAAEMEAERLATEAKKAEEEQAAAEAEAEAAAAQETEEAN